jgi:hypothetical protein
VHKNTCTLIMHTCFCEFKKIGSICELKKTGSISIFLYISDELDVLVLTYNDETSDSDFINKNILIFPVSFYYFFKRLYDLYIHHLLNYTLLKLYIKIFIMHFFFKYYFMFDIHF